MTFGAAYLRAVLEEHLPAGAGGLVAALSGGADSACLAAALAQLAEVQPVRGLAIRALHVDHQLQFASAALRESSVALCRRLHIPLTVLPATVDTTGGVSIEAAARDARYRVLAEALRPGECLLTAHHAQDQAETLLLQLLRGAGVKGLSAMPMCRPLGGGWHLRPLLDVPRRDLKRFAAAERALEGMAVEDPMNFDARFDRAYVRLQLWPAIERRWPGAAAALARAAHHLAEAQELLDRSGARHLERLRDGEALSVRGLRALPPAEQINTLRHWLCAARVTPPPAARLKEVLRQALAADADHLPAVICGPHALRRYRDNLLITPAAPPSLGARREWPIVAEARLELGAGLGTLRWTRQLGGFDASRLPSVLSVRQRSGGETLKVARRGKTRSVQHLCQSMGVLPWMRDALPFLYAGDTLIAVADLWQDARWCVAGDTSGFGCVWEDAPGIV